VDHVRKKKQRYHEIQDNMASSDNEYLYSGSTIPHPDEDLDRRELMREVEEAIESLPNMQKQVFVLRHYEGLSLRDISDILGRHIGTVKANLFHATRKLRTCLASSMNL
jgi:RNA polymerase sigma-70 factor (ECF subfamily)